MSLRVSPIERVRAEIDDLFGSDRELADVSEGLARLGVCLSMQIAIEAEVTEFLAGIATGTAPGLGPGAVTGTVRPRSRPLPGRWRSTRRSCGAPTTGCFSAAGRRGVSPERGPARGGAGVPVLGRQPLPYARGRPVRARPGCVGISTEGRPALVDIDAGANEPTDVWMGVIGQYGHPGTASSAARCF